jgi:putative FmdB family regulatory protein
MPVYEYECDKCALKFEVKRGFHESGGNVCPNCGGEARQIFFAAPLHFKGSGFYCTENRKGKGSESEEAKPAAEAAVKPVSADTPKPTGKSGEPVAAMKPAATQPAPTKSEETR